MYSIGTIAALGAAGLTGITSRLPWGWFTLMAILDLALVAMVVARRHRGRSAKTGVRRAPARSDALVLRSGWWVPRSRALALSAHQPAYAWPLHREYMVCRVV